MHEDKDDANFKIDKFCIRENFSLMDPASATSVSGDLNFNTLVSSGIGTSSVLDKTMKTEIGGGGGGSGSTTTGGSTSGGGGRVRSSDGAHARAHHYAGHANTHHAGGKIEGSLVGWLQVRDIRNRKNYLQVVDPAPRGPWRRAPWHNGTFHVLKL